MTISPSDRQAVLGVLERLAIEAGAEILDVCARQFDIEQKADGSPVTEADRRAEKVIVSGLLQHFPESVIVAEEMIAAGDVPPDLGEEFFLVDALDGTREFCAQRDEFTVNIALIRHGVPVAGVVYAPAMGVIFSGEHDGTGQGSATTCTVSKAGALLERTPVRARACPPQRTVLASRSHMTPETQHYLDRFPDAHLQSIGSSLKFCLIAQGKADLYPRFGPTMEWDTAAGDAILRAAGGSTATPAGKPLIYGKRGQAGQADFQNPHFVSRGG